MDEKRKRCPFQSDLELQKWGLGFVFCHADCALYDEDNKCCVIYKFFKGVK